MVWIQHTPAQPQNNLNPHTSPKKKKKKKKFADHSQSLRGSIIFAWHKLFYLSKWVRALNIPNLTRDSSKMSFPFKIRLFFPRQRPTLTKQCPRFCTTYLKRNTLKGIKFSVYSWHLQSKRGKEKKNGWWFTWPLVTYKIFYFFIFFILHNMIIINQLFFKKMYVSKINCLLTQKKKKIYRIVSRHNSFYKLIFFLGWWFFTFNILIN